MSEKKHIDETLWNYIDGSMSHEEMLFVEKLLQTDAAWKAKYNELLDVHTLMLDSIALDQPSMRFTQNVMEEISRLYITPAASTYINKNVVRGIGLFFLITIIGLVVYGLGQTDWSTAQPLPGMSSIGKIDWSKFYNSSYTSIFAMVNVVLALMLVDMQLTRKRKLRRTTSA